MNYEKEILEEMIVVIKRRIRKKVYRKKIDRIKSLGVWAELLEYLECKESLEDAWNDLYRLDWIINLSDTVGVDRDFSERALFLAKHTDVEPTSEAFKRMIKEKLFEKINKTL